jgi:hypothetical protein
MNTISVIFSEETMFIKRDVTVKMVVVSPHGDARIPPSTEGHHYAYAILRDSLEAILIKSDRDDIHGFVAFVHQVDKAKVPPSVEELINKTYVRMDFRNMNVYETATVMQSRGADASLIYWVVLHV